MSKREMSKKKQENVEDEKVYMENTEIHDIESEGPVAGKSRKEKIDRRKKWI